MKKNLANAIGQHHGKNLIEVSQMKIHTAELQFIIPSDEESLACKEKEINISNCKERRIL